MIFYINIFCFLNIIPWIKLVINQGILPLIFYIMNLNQTNIFSHLNLRSKSTLLLYHQIIILLLQGADVLVGGRRHSLGRTFYEPTVLGNVNNEMLISRYNLWPLAFLACLLWCDAVQWQLNCSEWQVLFNF